MAYAQQTNLDDQTQQGQQQQSQGGGTNISGTSAGSSSPNPSGNNSPAPTKSGSFTNLQNYLNANSGYNQGKGLAGQAYNTLSEQEKNQEQNINNASQNWQQQNASKDVQYNPNYTQNVLSNPTAYTSPENLSKWNKFYNAQTNYQAPEAFDANAQLQNQYKTFNQNTQLTQSEPGRYALLQQLYNNPSYNTGQQSLDNLLIQANPEQLKQLQSATSLGNQLGNVYNAQSTNAANLANQYASDAANAQQQARAALSGAETNAENILNNKVSSTNTQRQQDYQKLLLDISNKSLTTDELNALGLNSGSRLYNINLPSLIQQGTQATKYNIATPEDYAKFAALGQLAGQPINTYLSNANASQSNTLGGAYNVDKNNLQALINQSAANYNQAWNAPQTGTGGNNFSYNDMQNFVNQVANSQANFGRDPNDPSTWSGAQADQARDYLNQIQAFQNSQGYNNVLK